MALERDGPLRAGDRLLERQPAGLELRHDGPELGERVVEGQALDGRRRVRARSRSGLIGRRFSRHRASRRPRSGGPAAARRAYQRPGRRRGRRPRSRRRRPGRSGRALGRRGQVALRDPDRQAVPAGASVGRRTIAPSARPADDRVAAVERRLRAQDGQGGRARVQRGPRGSDPGKERARRVGAGGPERGRPSLDRDLRHPDRPIQQQPDALAIRDELDARVQPVERPPLDRQLAPDGVQQPGDRGRGPIPRPAERPEPLRPVRHHELRRRGRGRRPDVRREVGERHVDLVADPGHDRQPVLDDRPDDPFVVERPEVLERAAAAGEDRQLGRLGDPSVPIQGLQPALQPAERPDDALRRALALDAARHEEHPRHRPAPGEHRRDVVPDDPGRARDHGDRRGSLRQRSLAVLGEQPLGVEAGLQRLEPDREVAEPRRLDRFDVELDRALLLEQVDPAVRRRSGGPPAAGRRTGRGRR